jgi:hypothetical protein
MGEIETTNEIIAVRFDFDMLTFGHLDQVPVEVDYFQGARVVLNSAPETRACSVSLGPSNML